MIRVTVYEHKKVPYGIALQGHAGAGSEGNDIVCAAVKIPCTQPRISFVWPRPRSTSGWRTTNPQNCATYPEPVSSTQALFLDTHDMIETDYYE